MASKPQLEPQIRGRDDDPDLELAYVEQVAPGETRPSLVFLDELMLLYPGEIALDIAQLDGSS